MLTSIVEREDSIEDDSRYGGYFVSFIDRRHRTYPATSAILSITFDSMHEKAFHRTLQKQNIRGLTLSRAFDSSHRFELIALDCEIESWNQSTSNSREASLPLSLQMRGALISVGISLSHSSRQRRTHPKGSFPG